MNNVDVKTEYLKWLVTINNVLDINSDAFDCKVVRINRPIEGRDVPVIEISQLVVRDGYLNTNAAYLEFSDFLEFVYSHNPRNITCLEKVSMHMYRLTYSGWNTVDAVIDGKDSKVTLYKSAIDRA